MAIGCLALFLALLLNINYVQFIAADDLNAQPGNRRVIDEEFSRKRGPILVAGNSIAQSVRSNDRYDFQRVYSQPRLYANLTGFYYLLGRTGIENSMNSILAGSDSALFVDRLADMVGSRQPEGGQVRLTIDPQVQQAAYQGLLDLPGESSGAAVALDPQTGAVLAMTSVPSYDPNELASHDVRAVLDAYERLEKDPDNPLLDRSRMDIYPPGSTFKLVTAAAALSEDGLGLSPDSTVRAGATLDFPGIAYQLPNQGGTDCGGEQITFTAALEVSCNTAFGRLAQKLGADAIVEQAERFGFGNDSYLDELSMVPSQVVDPGEGELDGAQTARTGIGQENVAVTPLQMALVVAGIANQGTVMKPYLVGEVLSPSLDVLDEAEPTELSEAMTPEDSDKLTTMMESVVTNGTASAAAIDGVDVAAKTGTAQTTEESKPYAWFVSFAPADDPQTAVAVFVQDASGVARGDVAGGLLAGPIAKSMMEAALE
jgi:peptidoglycan glycosyltransferase